MRRLIGALVVLGCGLCEGFGLIQSRGWGVVNMPTSIRSYGHVQRSPVRMMSSTGSANTKEAIMDMYKNMRAKQIKEICVQKGLKTDTYTDKDQLLELLVSFELKNAASASNADDNDGTFDSTKPDSSTQRVPMEITEAGNLFLGLSKKYPVIDMEIKGKKYKFLIDMGCSIALIPKSKAKALGYKILGETKGMGSGGLFPGTRVKIDRVGIASSVRDFRAVVVDDVLLPQFPDNVTGILGFDFLESLGSCDLNLKMGIFRFGPPESIVYEGVGNKFKGIPLERQMMAEAIVKGKDSTSPVVGCSGIVDPGSPYTIMNSRAVEACALDRSNNRDSDLEIFGPNGENIRVKERDVETVILGSHKYSLEKVYIAELPGLEILGMDRMPVIIIGTDTLKKGRYLLDARNLQLWVPN